MFDLEKLLCFGVLDSLVTWHGEAASSFSSHLRDPQGEGEEFGFMMAEGMVEQVLAP